MPGRRLRGYGLYRQGLGKATTALRFDSLFFFLNHFCVIILGPFQITSLLPLAHCAEVLFATFETLSQHRDACFRRGLPMAPCLTVLNLMPKGVAVKFVCRRL